MRDSLKKWGFLLVMAVISAIALELLVCAYHFQRSNPLQSATVFYANAALNRYYDLTTRIGIFRKDSTFGFSHIPDSQGRHNRLDFDVTYTIGHNQERVMPQPRTPRGWIVFLGCSFTFGYGVGDDKTYPCILARNHWTSWALVNRATIAWGTSQAYLLVSQQTEGVRPPSAIIYGMLPHHISRNYLRMSWMRELTKYDRDQPHFEMVDGKPLFRGVVGIHEAIEDSPDVRKKELELTRSFLMEMQSKCRAKRIPFFVVLLPGADWPPVIVKTLIESQIQFLDLSEMKIDTFAHDHHPSERGQAQIAEAIAHSFVNDEIQKLGARVSSNDHGR